MTVTKCFLLLFYKKSFKIYWIWMECFISFKTLIFLVLLSGLQFWKWWHTLGAVAVGNCRISLICGGTYPGAKSQLRPLPASLCCQGERYQARWVSCFSLPPTSLPLCLPDGWAKFFGPAHEGVQIWAHCQWGAPELLHEGAMWVPQSAYPSHTDKLVSFPKFCSSQLPCTRQCCYWALATGES